MPDSSPFPDETSTRTRSTLKNDVYLILLWIAATPFLAVWPIASFLPVFSIMDEGRTVASVLADIAFLGTGAVGLAALYAAAFLGARPDARAALAEFRRGKALFVAAYGAIWLFVYMMYRSYGA